MFLYKYVHNKSKVIMWKWDKWYRDLVHIRNELSAAVEPAVKTRGGSS